MLVLDRETYRTVLDEDDSRRYRFRTKKASEQHYKMERSYGPLEIDLSSSEIKISTARAIQENLSSANV